MNVDGPQSCNRQRHLFAMLSVSYAASGETLVTLAAEEVVLAHGKLSVRRLRQYLTETHFQKSYTRFQLKILDQAGQLDDNLIISPPAELQLMILSYPETNSDEELETRLFGACEQGDLQEVETCLEAMIHPNTDMMCDPIHNAAGAGYPEIVKILLEARAESNALSIHRETPLHLAAQGRRNDEGVYAEIIKILLQARAHIDAEDMRGETALTYAAKGGRSDVVAVLLEAGCNKSPASLRGAVSWNRLNVVRLLIAAGVPHVATESGESLLFQAASYGYDGVVRALLESGAPIDAPTHTGCTPLHAACHPGHIQVVQALLEAGADKELADDQGRRALHVAAQHDHLKILRLLLEAGSDVAAVDALGKTSLHIAGQYGHMRIARVLLAVGGNKEAQDSDGRTPCSWHVRVVGLWSCCGRR